MKPKSSIYTPEPDNQHPHDAIPFKWESPRGVFDLIRQNCTLMIHRYIQRFRNAPPTSRQERDHKYFDSEKGGEFWWLSPSPPSSSTPKEGTPPDRQLPSPRPSLSPKMKRSTFRRSASPASPISVSQSSQIINFMG